MQVVWIYTKKPEPVSPISRQSYDDQTEPLPYNVGVLTQEVVRKILQYPDILQQQADAIKAERVVMNKYLNVLDGVEAFPSDANFILFRVSKASQVFSELKKRNILIKNLYQVFSLL